MRIGNLFGQAIMNDSFDFRLAWAGELTRKSAVAKFKLSPPVIWQPQWPSLSGAAGASTGISSPLTYAVDSHTFYPCPDLIRQTNQSLLHVMKRYLVHGFTIGSRRHFWTIMRRDR